MNSKIKVKALLSILMSVGVLSGVSNFSVVHGMKRNKRFGQDEFILRRMSRETDESSVVNGGLSYQQISLRREWFSLLECGSLQRIRHFFNIHGEEGCINWVDSLGVTSLNYAISQGRIYAVEFLLSNGADVNALDTLGHTPLMCVYHYICRGTDLVMGQDILELLCSYHPNINIAGTEGNTVLHLVADAGNEYLYDRFVKMGGNVDATNYLGVTPRRLYDEASLRNAAESDKLRG